MILGRFYPQPNRLRPSVRTRSPPRQPEKPHLAASIDPDFARAYSDKNAVSKASKGRRGRKARKEGAEGRRERKENGPRTWSRRESACVHPAPRRRRKRLVGRLRRTQARALFLSPGGHPRMHERGHRFFPPQERIRKGGSGGRRCFRRPGAGPGQV